MRGGEVDAIYPSPQTALAQLVHQSGLKYSSIPGFTQEHIDLQTRAAPATPLLKQQLVPPGDRCSAWTGTR